MNVFYKLIIEQLNSSHDKSGFKCGVESLDNYLKKQAGQDMKRHISRVYIALKPDSPDKIIGYYTLSSLSIELKEFPQKLSKRLPKHPIPAALIGSLAVARSEQRNGVGKMLLADAIKRTMGISNEIAIYAMVVDAINDKAKYFYEQFGFELLNEKSCRLFLSLKSISKS